MNWNYISAKILIVGIPLKELVESRNFAGLWKVVVKEAEHIYLLTAFPKNEKANLSKQERNLKVRSGF